MSWHTSVQPSPAQPRPAGPLVSIRDIWSPSSGAGGRQPLPLTAGWARPGLRCGCIPLPDAAAALPGPHTTTRQMSNLADVGPELRAGAGVGFHLTLGQHIMKKFLVIIPALLGTYLALKPGLLFHNFLVQASPRRISPEAMWPRRPTRCRCPRRAPRCRPTTPSTTTPTSPRPSPSPRWTGEL